MKTANVAVKASPSTKRTIVGESVIDSLLKNKQNEDENLNKYDDHVDSKLIEKIKNESDEELFSEDVEARQKKAIENAQKLAESGSSTDKSTESKEKEAVTEADSDDTKDKEDKDKAEKTDKSENPE